MMPIEYEKTSARRFGFSKSARLSLSVMLVDRFEVTLRDAKDLNYRLSLSMNSSVMVESAAKTNTNSKSRSQ